MMGAGGTKMTRHYPVFKDEKWRWTCRQIIVVLAVCETLSEGTCEGIWMPQRGRHRSHRQPPSTGNLRLGERYRLNVCVLQIHILKSSLPV